MADGDPPLSPPTSPKLAHPHDVDSDSYAATSTTDPPSSPPTSISTNTNHNHAHKVQVEDVPDIDDDDAGYGSPALAENDHHHLPQQDAYSSEDETADADADAESNWASDAAPGPEHTAYSSARQSRLSTPGTGVGSARKALPRGGAATSSRPSGVSTKKPPQASALRFSGPRVVSGASSAGSYEPRSSVGVNGAGGDGRKAPLVLLHISLLLMPGVEEVAPVLKRLTPTTLARGLLIEHPRGDYKLLEELIMDGLGLDEADDEAGAGGDDADDDGVDGWASSLGVRKVLGRDRWDIRVYAANGLMTQGAWRRVWTDMERVDVEVSPKLGAPKPKPNIVRQALTSVRSKARSSAKSIRNSRLVQRLPALPRPPKDWRHRCAALPWLRILLVLFLGASIAGAIAMGWAQQAVDSVAEWRASYETYLESLQQPVPEPEPSLAPECAAQVERLSAAARLSPKPNSVSDLPAGLADIITAAAAPAAALLVDEAALRPTGPSSATTPTAAPPDGEEEAMEPALLDDEGVQADAEVQGKGSWWRSWGGVIRGRSEEPAAPEPELAVADGEGVDVTDESTVDDDNEADEAAEATVAEPEDAKKAKAKEDKKEGKKEKVKEDKKATKDADKKEKAKDGKKEKK